MGTETTGMHRQTGRLRRTLYQYRVSVSAVLAVAVVAGLLLWLDGLAVPLAEAPVLREGSAAITGGEMSYNAYEGLWLLVRALLGLYIGFVAVLISAFAIVSWKEVLE